MFLIYLFFFVLGTFVMIAILMMQHDLGKMKRAQEEQVRLQRLLLESYGIDATPRKK
jgi:hypothetical protein